MTIRLRPFSALPNSGQPARLCAVLALLAALLVADRTARAMAVGSVFSGPTADDPMVIYWNAAAMTLRRGTSGMAYGGVTLIAVDFDRSTPSALDGSLYPQANLRVPKPELGFGAVTDATLRDVRFGVGLFLPIIDGATWPLTTEGSPSATRYYAMDARQVHIILRPAVAYRVNRYLSIGMGFDVYALQVYQRSMIDFGARINQIACQLAGDQCLLDAPLAREDPTFDAEAIVDGMGWALGASGGILVTPRRWLRLALAFHSGASVSVPVEMQITLPEALRRFVADNLPSVQLPQLTAEGSLESSVNPLTIIAGVWWQLSRRLELDAYLLWQKKSDMGLRKANIHRASSELISDQVLVRGEGDAWYFGVRANVGVLRHLRGAVSLAVIPNNWPEEWTSPVTINFNKIEMQLGLRWRPRRWLWVYAEYVHFFLFSRTIERSYFAPNADPRTPEEEGLDLPSPLGEYSGFANRVAAGVRVEFR